jgi:hypothetical protein
MQRAIQQRVPSSARDGWESPGDESNDCMYLPELYLVSGTIYGPTRDDQRGLRVSEELAARNKRDKISRQGCAT